MDRGIEPGSERSCLRPIVKTGDPKLDAFYDAVVRASVEDWALLLIAIGRRDRGLPPEAGTVSPG